MQLHLTDNKFNTNPYWSERIKSIFACPPKTVVELFDQNGYDLTSWNNYMLWPTVSYHTNTGTGSHHTTSDWFTADDTEYGPHINHAYMFERKGYSGRCIESVGKLGSIQTTLLQTDSHETQVGTGLQHRLL